MLKYSIVPPQYPLGTSLLLQEEKQRGAGMVPTKYPPSNPLPPVSGFRKALAIQRYWLFSPQTNSSDLIPRIFLTALRTE